MFGEHISLKEQIRAEAQGGTPLEGQDGSLTGSLLQGGSIGCSQQVGGQALLWCWASLPVLQGSSGSPADLELSPSEWHESWVLGYAGLGQVWVGMCLKNS